MGVTKWLWSRRSKGARVNYKFTKFYQELHEIEIPLTNLGNRTAISALEAVKNKITELRDGKYSDANAARQEYLELVQELDDLLSILQGNLNKAKSETRKLRKFNPT